MRIAQVVPGLMMLACGVGVFAGCRSESKPIAPLARAEPSGFRPERVAELYFTTGVAGWVEPCGCTTKPLGGLARLAGALESSPLPRALVDAGALFLPDKPLDDFTRPQHRTKARFIARAYRRLGAAAINLAPTDLKEGTELLTELQREGAVPLVSANVRPRGDGGPEVARSHVRTIGGIRLGITGLAIPEDVAVVTDEVAALEFAPSVRAEIDVLREAGAEVVVVLAHLTEPDARALAEAIPEIDLIIRSPGTPIEHPPSPPVRAGQGIIVEAGRQGQHVGRVRFAFGASTPPRPLVLDDNGARLMSERSRLERRISALEREMERFSHDPAQSAVVEARRKLRDTLRARLLRSSSGATSPEGPHASLTLIPLGSEIPEEEGMRRLLGAYYQTLRETNRDRADPEACRLPSESTPSYVGTSKCMSCHQTAYDFWRKTEHASAWETLSAQDKHYDLTCIGCHSVGFLKPGGFCRIGDVEPYRNVGCESCHGPGSAHANKPLPGSIDRAASVATCVDGCHVPEHSDGFVYESYVRRVTGTGHAREKGGG